jgi:uncharacterized protein
MKTAITLEALRARREEILRMAAEHGVHDIHVFGSVVRGEAGPDSDVDFLVAMQPRRSLFDLVGFINDMEDLFGCKVDAVTEPGLHWLIKDRVMSEAVPL